MCRRSFAALAVVLVLGACGGSDAPSTPSATVAPSTSGSANPTTTTTAEPSTPEEEVEAAYLKSWDVYTDAVRSLDPASLDESYAGPALETVRREVERYRQDGTPVQVRVDHEYHVQMLEPGLAAVVDQYTNHSVLLDSAGQQKESDPNERIAETYTLKNDEGMWKVTSIVG